LKNTSRGSEARAETRVNCRVDSGAFCGLCCFETEMPLSEEDITRLEGLGYKREDFSIQINGIRRLRNVSGRCFFLSEDNRCRVYGERPEGCRLYPAVLNPDTMEVEVDDACPKAETVVIEDDVRQALAALFRKIYSKDKSEKLKKEF